ncbi:MAG: CGLAU_01105 family protein [Corynebacterium camporealensis]|uniref:CGLAU_01105 family protein n=1 Tax=Corynebacterium camporealensis TaxID=161896 RepID=UPI002A90F259|nr:CGLAU_01105 family protein [Corynebacterium camporealensis]MDY5841068.1 CGLAU_01105 family protein [Corynebacterium camporealensis]
MAEQTPGNDNTGNNNDNKVFDSIKNAGASAFSVAKDFSNRLKEDRATKSDAAGAESATQEAADQAAQNAEDGKESFIDRATGVAKDWGDSIKRAADGTRESDTFTEAKDKIGAAYQESRSAVGDAVDKAKERRAEKNSATAGAGDNIKDDRAADDIIEGEVVEGGEHNPNQP